MARKGTKKERKVNQERKLNEEKLAELQRYWNIVQKELDEYEANLIAKGNDLTMKIHKMYKDAFEALPKTIQEMTLVEYLNARHKALTQQSIPDDDLQSYSSQYERTKLLSEKKRTLKKIRTERKRSLSASISSGFKIQPQHLLSSRSRVLSDSSLHTPLKKNPTLPGNLITPKFNPKIPLLSSAMRRARKGEVLMSLSGSPIQNFVDEIADKPGQVALSLGDGKIIKISDDSEISALEKDFATRIDEDTKQTLASVQEKLARMLQQS